jgi:hypothetical protein
MTSILISAETVNGHGEVAIYRSNQQAPYHMISAKTTQEAVSEALKYGLDFNLGEDVKVISDCAVSIDPKLKRFFKSLSVQYDESGDRLIQATQQIHHQHEDVLRYEELRRLTAGIVQTHPSLEEWKKLPVELQKGEGVSRLRPIDRDFVQSWDVKPTKEGWIERHPDLGAPIGTSRRTDSAGFTGTSAQLNQLLANLEAGPEMRRVFFAGLNNADWLKPGTAAFNQLTNSDGLSPFVEESVTPLQVLTRLSESFGKLQPKKEPRIYREIAEDPELRKRLIREHPELEKALCLSKELTVKDTETREEFLKRSPVFQAATVVLKKLVKDGSQRTKLSSGRQYSRFHFHADHAEGFCPQCERNVASLAAGECFCPVCASDLDPIQFICSKESDLLNRVALIQHNLKSRIKGNKRQKAEVRSQCFKTSDGREVSCLFSRWVNHEKLVVVYEARVMRIQQSVDRFREQMKAYPKRRIVTLQGRLAEVSERQKNLNGRIEELKTRLFRRDPDGSISAFTERQLKLDRIEYEYSLRFNSERRELYQRINWWSNVQHELNRFMPSIESERKKAQNTKLLSPVADGTSDGTKALLNEIKKGTPAFYDRLFDIGAERKIRLWMMKNHISSAQLNGKLSSNQVRAFVHFWTGVPPEGDLLIRLCRLLLRPYDNQLDSQGKRNHETKLHLLVWALTEASNHTGESLPTFVSDVYRWTGGTTIPQEIRVKDNKTGNVRMLPVKAMLHRLLSSRARTLKALAANGLAA